MAFFYVYINIYKLQPVCFPNRCFRYWLFTDDLFVSGPSLLVILPRSQPWDRNAVISTGRSLFVEDTVGCCCVNVTANISCFSPMAVL